jgi:hypothetical protein
MLKHEMMKYPDDCAGFFTLCVRLPGMTPISSPVQVATMHTSGHPGQTWSQNEETQRKLERWAAAS